jgi:hypothetical protein
MVGSSVVWLSEGVFTYSLGVVIASESGEKEGQMGPVYAFLSD